jgi:hypothetical protein
MTLQVGKETFLDTNEVVYIDYISGIEDNIRLILKGGCHLTIRQDKGFNNDNLFKIIVEQMKKGA